MTLGQLADKLAELRTAEADVAEAERLLRCGGNEDTVHRKTHRVAAAQAYVDMLREQELEL